MPKHVNLTGLTKHGARNEDRHLPTQPQDAPWIWARGLTTTRVADLFRTQAGLAGHWQQLQVHVNAGNNYFFTTTRFGEGYNDGGKTSEEGKTLMRWIADAIIAAAKEADFDFTIQQLQFTRDMGWLKLLRADGQVVVHSKP
jgi:hypothetical protein